MKISIIIPTLNEAGTIQEALRCAGQGSDIEVIIADGGSEDQTIQLAQAAGCEVLRTPRGRAHQMNQGAAAASGEILLFLHADTRLPSGFDDEIRKWIRDGQTDAGAFRISIDAPGILYQALGAGINLRARILRLPYGDQALFVKKDFFHRIGGYAGIPFMEDFELIRRIKKHRGRLRIIQEAVITSSRRWDERGFFWNTVMNQAAVALYLLGVSPHVIARWYH